MAIKKIFDDEYIISIRQKMEQLQPKFFEKASKQALEKLGQASQIVLASQFAKVRHDLGRSVRLVILTGTFLVYYEDHTKSKIKRTAELTFETRFELLRDEWKDPKVPGTPFGIRFEKEGHRSMCLYLQSIDQLLQWKYELQKRINQRGFHTLFKPIKKIGKGNFASVYLAERLQDKKLVAVKAFSKQSTFSQDKGKESLLNQMSLMRQLHHKNIMKLYGVFQSENSIYITVQLLEGGQLFNKIQSRHKFTHEQTRKIMHGLMSGIQCMHGKRIMHRDLKPENILLRYEGDYEVVIADFGLATWADEEEYLFVRCGTPGYVAPEIINIKNLKTKSEPICDVFSAGLIFHILLMGKSIFPGRTYNDVLVQNRACDFNLFSSQYLDTLDKHTHDLLTRMLDKNPQSRISATQALHHPYFSAMQIEQQNREQQFLPETPLIKRDSNKEESVKLSIKPSISIHEDYTKVRHSIAQPKSINKENMVIQQHGTMLKNKKISSEFKQKRAS